MNEAIEILAQTSMAGVDNPGYGIGKMRGPGDGADSDRFALFPISDQPVMSAGQEAYIELPPMKNPRIGLLIPPLTMALWAWDRLGLEMGEAAVVSGGQPYTRLLTYCASLRGALPVIELGSRSTTETDTGFHYLSIDDPDSALRTLTEQIADKPGVCMVDLSGEAKIMDLFFAAMPRFGRLMLSSISSEPLTVDFYNHIHRTGARIEAGKIMPQLVFDPAWRDELTPVRLRATRLVNCLAIAEKLQSLVPIKI
ncbi:MAG: hypothetical protein AB2823_05035 [Candidatus Thiodiazotropha endolucinida]